MANRTHMPAPPQSAATATSTPILTNSTSQILSLAMCSSSSTRRTRRLEKGKVLHDVNHSKACMPIINCIGWAQKRCQAFLLTKTMTRTLKTRLVLEEPYSQPTPRQGLWSSRQQVWAILRCSITTSRTWSLATTSRLWKDSNKPAGCSSNSATAPVVTIISLYDPSTVACVESVSQRLTIIVHGWATV